MIYYTVLFTGIGYVDLPDFDTLDEAIRAAQSALGESIDEHGQLVWFVVDNQGFKYAA